MRSGRPGSATAYLGIATGRSIVATFLSYWDCRRVRSVGDVRGRDADPVPVACGLDARGYRNVRAVDYLVPTPAAAAAGADSGGLVAGYASTSPRGGLRVRHNSGSPFTEKAGRAGR